MNIFDNYIALWRYGRSKVIKLISVKFCDFKREDNSPIEVENRPGPPSGGRRLNTSRWKDKKTWEEETRRQTYSNT